MATSSLIGAFSAKLSRLAISTGTTGNVRHFVTSGGPLCFQATQILGAEPLKKRKKYDINAVILRENKKKKRLEKEIKHIEKKGRTLKPIMEFELENKIAITAGKRARDLNAITFEQSEKRALLLKNWHRYKLKQHCSHLVAMDVILHRQQMALAELRNESEELYQAAVELDEDLFPFSHRGPSETPPLERFDAPDGDYFDTTNKFDKR